MLRAALRTACTGDQDEDCLCSICEARVIKQLANSCTNLLYSVAEDREERKRTLLSFTVLFSLPIDEETVIVPLLVATRLRLQCGGVHYPVLWATEWPISGAICRTAREIDSNRNWR